MVKPPDFGCAHIPHVGRWRRWWCLTDVVLALREAAAALPSRVIG
jgi:hypothetical protein